MPRTESVGEVSGRIAGAGIGMGYGWWQDKHTRHHADPDNEGLDPGVAPDLLVWSQDQAPAVGLPRLVGRRQAFLFFPLLTLEDDQSVRAAVPAGNVRRRRGHDSSF
ncbi:hypothetical protein GCM10022384_66710 [Streptomyces marokkonensis]|uniref:Acyl-CoA desaturase n=1 Tax=Streptomyces marokkonensis TaxID=324855 RepID=A0ABP7SJU4_9ACTN